MFNLQPRSEENTKTTKQFVQSTSDWNRFKIMQGNRELHEGNIQAIMNQISAHGQRQPIIVNEKNEVVDGQHRLIACQRLNTPVKFIVDVGATIDHVISANIVGKKWNLMDYINRYVAEGSEDYKQLKHFILECKSHGISASCALQLTRGGHSDIRYVMCEDGKVRMHYGQMKHKVLYKVGNDVNLGKFKMPNAKKIEKRLESVLQFRSFPFYKHSRFISALLQVIRISDFDLMRLVKQSEKYPSRFTNEPDTESFVRMFESIYNYRLKHKLPLVNNPERRK